MNTDAGYLFIQGTPRAAWRRERRSAGAMEDGGAVGGPSPMDIALEPPETLMDLDEIDRCVRHVMTGEMGLV